MERVKLFFKLDEHGTNFQTEIVAGISTFLALSYIFVVNPAILSEGGMNKSAVLFATVLTSSFATLAMGLWAQKPFVLAPGLEMNSYAVYYIILALGFSWQNALGIVFWSGVLFMVFTLTKIRERIIFAIPDSLKIGLAASVGVFLMIVALKLSGLLLYDGVNIKSFGELFSGKTLILISSIVMIIGFNKFNIKGSVLLSIILASLLSNIIGLLPASTSKVAINNEMFGAILKLDFSSILHPRLMSALIILFVIDFYGSIAKFIGLTMNTSIVDKEGKLPRMKETLSVDGYATLVGSFLGTTSVTTYVESGVGIGIGGRTGLTSVVCALLMFLFIPLAPLLNSVPIEATTGALFIVGLELMPKYKAIKTWKFVEIIPVAMMIITTFVSFSLDKAMLIGFTAFIFGMILKRKWREINLYLVISTILILIATIFSILE